jgi:hypothetical protein
LQAQPVDALRKPRADPAGKIPLSSSASSVIFATIAERRALPANRAARRKDAPQQAGLIAIRRLAEQTLAEAPWAAVRRGLS